MLGKSGRFDGDDVLDLLLARPETAQFIAAKLWREFVSSTPDPKEVARWAAVFRDARYEVKPLLRAIFTSEAFWSPENRGALIKSPVDIVVGTLRTFAISPFDLRPAVFACAALGQNLFSPPNVKGWPGGDAWINTSTLLGRKQWVERVFRGSDPAMMAVAQSTVEPKAGPGERYRRMLERGMVDYAFDADRFDRSIATPSRDDGRVERLVLAAEAVNPVPRDLDTAQRVRALVSDPAYQLR